MRVEEKSSAAAVVVFGGRLLIDMRFLFRDFTVFLSQVVPVRRYYIGARRIPINNIEARALSSFNIIYEHYHSGYY